MRNQGTQPNLLKLVRSHRREAMALGMLLVSASCVPAYADEMPLASEASQRNAASANSAAPPAPEPLVLRQMAPEQAAELNAAIPIVGTPNPAAASTVLRAHTQWDQFRSLDCLTSAIYYEAASETEDGQRAVAQVVLNRVAHPTYPNTVCGVVYQGSERTTGCQFSFTCDGSLARRPSIGAWARARRLAAEALAGRVYAPVGHSTHYHTIHVMPYWAPTLLKSAVIGAHIFYRWSGRWGQPSAFRERYAGREPDPIATATAAAIAKAAALPPVPVIPVKFTGLLQPSSWTPPELATQVTAPENNLPKLKLTSVGLPDSGIKEAYRNSGKLREKPLTEPAPTAAAAGEVTTPAGDTGRIAGR